MKLDNSTDPGMRSLDSRRIESIVERKLEVAGNEGGREGSAAAEHMETQTRRTIRRLIP